MAAKNSHEYADPCPAGQFQCGTGVCVSNASVCDGVENCSDGSDEGDCGKSTSQTTTKPHKSNPAVHAADHRLLFFLVHLIKANVTGTERLRLQVQNDLYTVCAEDWTYQLSDFFCRYLGYR